MRRRVGGREDGADVQALRMRDRRRHRLLGASAHAQCGPVRPSGNRRHYAARSDKRRNGANERHRKRILRPKAEKPWQV
ncbi:hypothetical protein GRJ2_002629600 [Grus japonensis]|uniref:Uncharacterized protein n=1 Tax=Grus japonensis TaxID=30415 RepID=A0ABC9XV62_GRUJA